MRGEFEYTSQHTLARAMQLLAFKWRLIVCGLTKTLLVMLSGKDGLLRKSD